MSTGARVIGVVGPSGVGKDSVMAGLVAACPGLGILRRHISRPPESGGEDHHALSEAEFHAARGRGEYVLHWGAHGLFYGIPAAIPAQGDWLVNLSRGVLAQAARVLPGFVVLHITASPAVLAARLAARGRETAEEIARRLAREGAALPEGLVIHRVVNDGPLAETVAAARAALYPARA